MRGSRGSSVNKETRLRTTGVQFPAGEIMEFFLLANAYRPTVEPTEPRT